VERWTLRLSVRQGDQEMIEHRNPPPVRTSASVEAIRFSSSTTSMSNPLSCPDTLALVRPFYGWSQPILEVEVRVKRGADMNVVCRQETRLAHLGNIIEDRHELGREGGHSLAITADLIV
jgi:hypothetical protein